MNTEKILIIWCFTMFFLTYIALKLSEPTSKYNSNTYYTYHPEELAEDVYLNENY